MRELRMANGEGRLAKHSASGFADSLVIPCATFATRGVTEQPLTTIQLSPAGRVQSTNGEFVMDRAAFERIKATFEKHGVEVPIDINHELVQDDLPPAQMQGAVGWIVNLAFNEKDGLSASVRWGEKGTELIRSGRFPYLSPTFYVDKESGDIVGLHSAGLVTLPAIPGMKKLAAGQKPFLENGTMDELKLIGKEFGLAEADCKADLIINKIGELKKAKAPTEDGEIAAHVRKALGLADRADRSEIVLTLSSKLGASTELAAMKAELEGIKDREATRTAEALREKYVKANKINPKSDEAMKEALAFAKRDPAGFERFMVGVTAFAEPGRTTGPAAPRSGAGSEAELIANAVKEHKGDEVAARVALQVQLKKPYLEQGFTNARANAICRETYPEIFKA